MFHRYWSWFWKRSHKKKKRSNEGTEETNVTFEDRHRGYKIQFSYRLTDSINIYPINSFKTSNKYLSQRKLIFSTKEPKNKKGKKSKKKKEEKNRRHRATRSIEIEVNGLNPRTNSQDVSTCCFLHFFLLFSFRFQ